MKDSFWFRCQGNGALLCIIIILLGLASEGLGWSLSACQLKTRSGQKRCCCCRLSLLNSKIGTPGDKDAKDRAPTTDRKNDSGYKFGDITRGVVGKLQDSVNSLTGKSKYEFGDLSRWLDERAKEGAVQLDQSVKNSVQQFTQRNDYQFGDITKELIRRFQDGDYKAEDIWLLLRITLIIGRHVFPPVAAALPVKVLMELVELSMAQSVSGDVTTILTSEVDKRMKQWIIGDRNYPLGEISKNLLKDQGHVVADLAKKAAVKLTEKDVYEVGDITKQLWKKYRENKNKKDEGHNGSDLPVSTGGSIAQSSSGPATIPPKARALPTMDESEFEAFEAWDKIFIATQHKASDASSSDTYFQQWDKALLEANRTGDSTAILKQKQIERASTS